MEQPLATHRGKNVRKLACDGYTEGQIAGLLRIPISDLRRDFAAELTRGGSQFESKVRQLRDEAILREDAEAICYERYLVAHVRLSQIRISNAWVQARIHGLSDGGDGGWTVGCAWPHFHSEKQLWLSNVQGARWRMFFAPEVVDEVYRIRLSFPSADIFKPYDAHYFSLVKPIQRFVAQAASEHLRRLNEQLNGIKVHEDILTQLHIALEAVESAIRSYRGNDVLHAVLAFIDQAESASGTSLTESEADQLVEGAYLVETVWGAAY
jgi:hypothetical protein